jgi:hypothetical protein
VNAIYLTGQSKVDKTRRLLHMNNLLKGTIEECIMYMKLMNLPLVRYNNGKNEPNSSWFNNKTEGFGVVKTSS